MTTRRVAAIAAVVVAAALSGAACAKKPASKAEAGQVAAAPAAPPPTTEEGCRACNGVWGPQGVDQTPRCVCRTRDAGKKCRGKDECEGDCIGDLGDREVTQPGPPPVGFWIGRCSEMRTTFGCHILLPAKPAAPVPLDEPHPKMCVD